MYSPWNIETTAKIILSKFTDSAVFVIKPAKMLLNTFSLYKNFLSFDEEGIPEFTKDFGALSHLHSLYNEAKHKMLEIELNNQVVNTSNDNSDRSCLATGTQEEGSHLATGKQGEDKCLATRSSESDIQEHPVLNSAFPIKLVGFSKGCVVLNQLIHELDHTKDNENLKVFISNISEIYWLDGGHIGGQGAYITEDKKLQDLKNLGCKIVVHVTPYQINDPMRRWIGEEEEKFVNELKELKADITEYRHFMDEIGHIQNHFKVLTLI